MDAELRGWLLDAGATDEEIARAEAEGWLPLLALDRVLLPGPARYDLEAVAAAAGTDAQTARRIWRALGFADVPEGVAVFGDRDAEALRLALSRFRSEDEPGRLERQVRVVAASLARLAAVEAELIGEMLDELAASTDDQSQLARAVVDEVDWPAFAQLIDHAHRVQLRAALWRSLVRDVFAEHFLAVGFVDLAGYTDLSVQLEPDDLAAVLTRFEELAYDSVARHGARVVKTIGDEVMFVGLADQVACVGCELQSLVAADPDVPQVRIGLAAGPLLPRDGDYYGPTVNLASRITELARPGETLATSSLAELLADDPRFEWSPRRHQRLRGLGKVDLFELRARAPAPSTG
jgi:adenylate cyclase